MILTADEPVSGELSTVWTATSPASTGGGSERSARHDLARRREPVLRKGSLQREHGRALNGYLHVPPVLRILGVTQPVVGDPRSSGERERPINNKDLR